MIIDRIDIIYRSNVDCSIKARGYHIGMDVIVSSRPVPVIDLDPFDEDVLEHPYRYDNRLREAGSLFFIEKYGVFGMARHHEVLGALKDHERFCSSRGVGLVDFAVEPPWRARSLLLESDPPAHSGMRRLMNGVVTLASLREARLRWEAAAERLVDRIVSLRSFDAIAEIAEAFPLEVFPETIGLMAEGREHLLPYAAAVFNAYGPKNHVWASTEEALPAAVTWVDEACRRESLSPDGWGARVYAAADDGLCTPAEAHRLVRSFLSAGVDTTVNGIANMLCAFVEHPEQWQALRDTPSLSKRAFDEALRWDSTAQIFFRTTTADVVVDDHLLPEGSKVCLFLAAANRDPRRWEDPSRFDISRVASGHVGFGFGIHQCLGQMVARQEAEVVLDVLARRITTMTATGPVIRRLNNSLHAVSSLPVEITV